MRALGRLSQVTPSFSLPDPGASAGDYVTRSATIIIHPSAPA